jgi:hypothetical protein
MAVSGTVPTASTPRVDPLRWARSVRRVTFFAGAIAIAWFFLRFGTEWVPRGMDTVPGLPPGAWCVVDRWSRGLRVGSDVFVDTPAGAMLSRIAALDATSVTLQHPNAASAIPDSRAFGAVPRTNVRGTVVVALQPSGADAGGR